MKIKIGTRKSLLALAQTDKVIAYLCENNKVDFEKVLITTEGDKRLDVTLDKIGGKGLFIKEIENCIYLGMIDCAVHSMKDVPFELPEGMSIVSIPEREDIRDCFIAREGIPFWNLKKGAKIGTSSIRRGRLLKELRRDIEILPIRGNVDTRIKKMHEEKLDGIILAAAGLKRLGRDEIITNYFNPEEFLPAVGQGAIGIECLNNSPNLKLFKSINNEEEMTRVIAERSFMKTLNGGCHSLIGVYSKIQGDDMYLLGTYEVGGKVVKKDILGNKNNPIELGKSLGKKFI